MTKRYLPIAALLLVTLFASALCIHAAEGSSAYPAASPSPARRTNVTGGASTGSTSRTSTERPTPTPNPPRLRTTPEVIGSPLPVDQPAPTVPAGQLPNSGSASTTDPTPSPSPYLTAEDLGLLDWFTNPFLFGLVAFLILMALALHLLHVLRVGSLSQEIAHLKTVQRSLGNVARGPVNPGNGLKVDSLAEQLNQQGQSLAQVSTHFNQIENRFTANESQLRDAIHAVTVTVNWIGQAQLREAFTAEGGNVSESERAATMALLERYEEPLRSNAGRLAPLAQEVTDAAARLEGRVHSSPELTARLQSLSEDIGRFRRWHQDVSDELNSLQRGSFAQRSARLKADQERLFDQLNSGSLSTTQVVKKSQALLDQYFPKTAARTAEQGQPLPERESSLKKRVTDAPDYLMNWYDSLFQLQSQLGGLPQRSAVEAETASDLLRIQQIARDALGKFDIQPEAIQIGQTYYDPRLHEAALVRQAPQFPVNTVIEVHKCGFRKMSTSEVLRIPQVVVAGAAAG
jgi:molecular chaperone GrpE (heat shock protein)